MDQPGYVGQGAEKLAPQPRPVTEFSLALVPFNTVSLSSHQINALENIYFGKFPHAVRNTKSKEAHQVLCLLLSG